MRRCFHPATLQVLLGIRGFLSAAAPKAGVARFLSGAGAHSPQCLAGLALLSARTASDCRLGSESSLRDAAYSHPHTAPPSACWLSPYPASPAAACMLRGLPQVPQPAPAAIPLQLYIASCIYQCIAVVILYIHLCSSIQMYALRDFRL